MKTIEDHIQYDLEHVNDPTVSSAARRHFKEELHELQEYAEHHKEESKQGIIMTQMHSNYFANFTQMNLSA